MKQPAAFTEYRRFLRHRAATTRLSQNFTLAELCTSSTALRKGIPNMPTPAEEERLCFLCSETLQPIRDVVGGMHIESGLRGPQLNKAVGGSSRSFHLQAAAADTWCTGSKGKRLFDIWRAALDQQRFDELCWEYNGWIHIARDKRTANPRLMVKIFKWGAPRIDVSLTDAQAMDEADVLALAG